MPTPNFSNTSSATTAVTARYPKACSAVASNAAAGADALHRHGTPAWCAAAASHSEKQWHHHQSGAVGGRHQERPGVSPGIPTRIPPSPDAGGEPAGTRRARSESPPRAIATSGPGPPRPRPRPPCTAAPIARAWPSVNGIIAPHSAAAALLHSERHREQPAHPGIEAVECAQKQHRRPGTCHLSVVMVHLTSSNTNPTRRRRLRGAPDAAAAVEFEEELAIQLACRLPASTSIFAIHPRIPSG